MQTAAIWLVLYHLGHIGGVWGPLPYDMAECEARRADLNAETQERVASGVAYNGMPIPERMLDQMATFNAACIRSPDRPQLGGK